MRGFDYVVVGAGLSGATAARRLLERGKRVAVVERQEAAGGLCSTHVDRETGIECHDHGTHVLHSSDPQAIAFLSRFCRLNHYRHRVYSATGPGGCSKVVAFPPNLQTINQLFGFLLSPGQARRMIGGSDPGGGEPANLREACIRQMGRHLYEVLIEGYSRKHWGVDPSELPASLAGRIPVRFSRRSDYFDDPWQGVPANGYADLFSRLLDGIPTFLGVDYLEARGSMEGDPIVVWTGPLDAWYGFRLGRLRWRHVSLELEVVREPDHQGCAVVNYPSEAIPWTRVHEFRHLHPERTGPAGMTLIAREFASSASGAQAYPVDQEGELARRYRAAAAAEPRVHFCGRLGTHRYLNMDQAVVEALALAERI